MMNKLSWAKIRVLVYERAEGCCEYCQTCEINTGQTMQVDHIIPDKNDDPANLCLACWNCNNHKHEATEALDPQTQQSASLFNPRTQIWKAHFSWIEDGAQIQGLTPAGRATVVRLKMNRPVLIAARKRWIKGGFHPPS